MKLIKLIWGSWIIKVFTIFFVSDLAWWFFAKKDSNDLKTIKISAFVAIALIILERIIEIYKNFSRFKKIEGTYKAYSYHWDKPSEKTEPGEMDAWENYNFKKFSEEDKNEFENLANQHDKDYNLLSDDCNGEATLKYCGGNEFTIKLVEKDGNIWKGRVEFTAINSAAIAWWYITPSSLRDTCGYKKAVVFEDMKPLRIYMFSTDNQRFGREVLIKNED